MTEEHLKLIPLYVGIIAAIAAIISKSPEFYTVFFATQRPSSLAKYNCLKVVQLIRTMLSDDEIKSLRKKAIYYALKYLGFCLAIYLYYQFVSASYNDFDFFLIIFKPLVTFSHPIKLLEFYIQGGNPLYAWLYIIFIFLEIILVYKLIGSLIILCRVFLLSINQQTSRMLFFKGACLKYDSQFMIIVNNTLNVLKYMNLRMLEINRDNILEDKFHIEVFTRKRFSSLCLLTIDICQACPEEYQIVAITIPVFDHPKYYEKVLRITNRFISLAVLDL